MNIFRGFFFFIVFMSMADAKVVSPIKSFQDYLQRAKKEYALSENKLIKLGDSHLRQHAFAAERLSLAELLPLQRIDLPKFCNRYPKEISNYYNLGNVNLVNTIKSPVYAGFSKMVQLECSTVVKPKAL
jgi:hypothetical protein